MTPPKCNYYCCFSPFLIFHNIHLLAKVGEFFIYGYTMVVVKDQILSGKWRESTCTPLHFRPLSVEVEIEIRYFINTWLSRIGKFIFNKRVFTRFFKNFLCWMVFVFRIFFCFKKIKGKTNTNYFRFTVYKHENVLHASYFVIDMA